MKRGGKRRAKFPRPNECLYRTCCSRTEACTCCSRTEAARLFFHALVILGLVFGLVFGRRDYAPSNKATSLRAARASHLIDKLFVCAYGLSHFFYHEVFFMHSYTGALGSFTTVGVRPLQRAPPLSGSTNVGPTSGATTYDSLAT